jgi:hypothetical protein
VPANQRGERVLIAIDRVPVEQFGIGARRARLRKSSQDRQDAWLVHRGPRMGSVKIISAEIEQLQDFRGLSEMVAVVRE